jgi:hypothetical protein
MPDPRIIVAAGILFAAAQVTPVLGQPLMVCGGRNHSTNATTGGFGLSFGESLGVRYVPPANVTPARLEFYFDPSPLFPTLGGLSVLILREHLGTSLPDPNGFVASGLCSSTVALPAWSGCDFGGQPATLLAGARYLVVVGLAPFVSTHHVPTYDDNGPDPTAYATIGVAPGNTWTPGAVPHRFMIRLWCAPAAIFGTGTCVGSNGVPTIGAAGGQFPTVGNNAFAIEVHNAASSSVSYWHLADRAEFASLTLPGGCYGHLELASTAAYFTAGLSPYATLSTDATGFVQLGVPIPNDPSIVGFIAATQVQIVDLTTVLGYTLTPALQVTILP